jgi:ribonucleoside-diphosphate reductase beta chain
MVYEDQSGEAFLTTQQVDEARHAQHFNRFYEQVVGLDMTFDERLRDVRRHVSDAFITLFDEHWCERTGNLPGFLEGFKRISQDEHRHVAYGTWFLQQKCKDPALARRVQDKLVELLPLAAGVLAPPGVDPFTEEWELMGFKPADVNEFAFRALTRRLKVIGVSLPAVGATA